MQPAAMMRAARMMCPAGHRGKHRITATNGSDIITERKRRNIISEATSLIRGQSMKENKLADMSMDFAVRIIELVKQLKDKRETVISNQIGRAGTSIGANIREANYAQGKKDFVSKLEIALKESNETGYWLELLFRTGYIDEATYSSLNSQCTSIRVMLIASCRTAKSSWEAK